MALSQVIAKSEGRFSKRLYLHAITQLLAGLHYFHELRDYDRKTPLNAIHRDVSPQNVILLYEGAVKVLDFGIAKIATEGDATRTGIVKGKLHYMPAEQLLSDQGIDRRADLFSAGIMLWEALAGRRMWLGHTEQTVMRSLLTGTLPNLRDVASAYPDHFYDIAARAIAFDPANRYSTSLEMQIDVERILGDLGGLVQPRELSEFMRVEFGEYRQKREAAIEAAVKQSLPPTSVSSNSSVGATTSVERPLPDVSRSSVTAAPSRSNRRNQILLAILLLAVVQLGVLAVGRLRSPIPGAGSATPKAPATAVSVIHVEISSNPPNATVWLDGKALGNTPFKGELPWSQGKGILELKADNYQSVTRTISLGEDSDIEIQLQPSALVVTPAQLPVKNLDQRKSTGHSRTAVSATGMASASPKVQSTTPATGTPNCKPPYTLSSDGIRTYKVECFGKGTR